MQLSAAVGSLRVSLATSATDLVRLPAPYYCTPGGVASRCEFLGGLPAARTGVAFHNVAFHDVFGTGPLPLVSLELARVCLDCDVAADAACVAAAS